MNQRNFSQTLVTIGCWLFLLLPLFFLPIVGQAETVSKADMAALYEQAFGKTKTPKPLVAAKTVKKEKSKSYSSADLSALYSQAFGNKKKTKKNHTSKKEFSGNDLEALYAQAFGKKPVSIMPSKVSVDLRVNQSVLGEVTVYSNRQNEMDRADAAQLLTLLEKVLKDHIFQKIKKQFASKKTIPFLALTKKGVKTTYNSVNLSLDLQINPALRKPKVLSLQAKKKASVRKENKISAEEISAFLNMYSNVGLNSGLGSSKADIKLKLEGSVAVGGAVLETTVDLKNKHWDMGRTTLTYDKPDKLQRFVVGNVSTGNRNFQENLELIGMRASKEFFMKPELQIRPRANQAFVLETESEVEVFINNQLRQRFYLQEGIYSLEDIGLYNGANNIRVRIKDAFGKVTIKKSQQYYDSHLLKPDLSLYSISVGYLSNKQAYIKDELDRKPIISGYYEKGLSKHLTMSLDLQVSPDSYLLGTEAITSMPLGSLKQSFAISGGKFKESGFATRFEFKPNIQREMIGLDTLREDMLKLDTSIGRFLNSWTITGEYRSENFSMLNQVEGVDGKGKKLKGRLQSQFSLDLSDNWRGTLNLGVANYYAAKNNLSANLTAIKRFNNGIRLSLGASYDSHDDLSMNLQISIPLDREERVSRRTMDFQANSKDRSLTSRLNYRPTSLVGKNSLGGSVEYVRSEDSNNAKLDMHYKNPKFETQLVARRAENRKTDSNSQRLSLGFNTSLACVGNHCGISYPINDSFALVKGPSNQDKAIAINDGHGQFKYSSENETGLPDNYTALIPKKGAYAVVPLESYRYQNINIDESTLPSGYDSEKTEFEVFPRYHQGFLVKAGGEPSTIIDGMLVDRNNKPLGYKGGQWISLANNGKTIAFFSNKIGRFRLASIPAGKYKLELFDYPFMQGVSINVPDKKGQVHDVGSLVITE